MKQLYIYFLITFLSTNIGAAQLETVVPFLGSTSYGLLLDGNLMYVTQNNYIRTLNITDNPPTTQIINQDSNGGLNQSLSIELNGSDLYVAAGTPDYRIVKLDASNPSAPPIYITNSDPSPSKVLFHGNDLYYVNFFNGSIFKLNITDPMSAPQTVVSGFTSIRGLTIKDNFLYFAQYIESGKLYKLDITEPSAEPIELATGLSRPYALKFKGDNLYISLLNGNKIVKTDVTQSLPLSMVNVVDILMPLDMVFNGDDLYIIHGQNHYILSKFDTSSLGVPESELSPVTLYPNPANDALFLSNLSTPSPYSIVDLLGRTLQEGIVQPHKGIAVADLSAGRYFINIGNIKVLSFIKK